MTIEAPQEGGTGGKQLELGESWRRPPEKFDLRKWEKLKNPKDQKVQNRDSWA